MRERRRTTSYTGFSTADGFQYPSVWKRAAQSVGTLLLVSSAAVLTCGVYRLVVQGTDCGAACSGRLALDVAVVAAGGLDLLLSVLLLLSMKHSWPAGTVTVAVWSALKGVAAIYLLVSVTYRLHTEPGSVLVEHYVGIVAAVLAMGVVLYTVASAANEQRAANRMDGDGIP